MQLAGSKIVRGLSKYTTIGLLPTADDCRCYASSLPLSQVVASFFSGAQRLAGRRRAARSSRPCPNFPAVAARVCCWASIVSGRVGRGGWLVVRACGDSGVTSPVPAWPSSRKSAGRRVAASAWLLCCCSVSGVQRATTRGRDARQLQAFSDGCDQVRPKRAC